MLFFYLLLFLCEEEGDKMLQVRWQKYLSYCSVTSMHLVSMVLQDGEAKRQAVQLSASSACLPVWRQGRQRLTSNISAARPASFPLMLLCAGTAEERNNEKNPSKIVKALQSSLAKTAKEYLQFILQNIYKRSQILGNFPCFSLLFVDWLGNREQGILGLFSPFEQTYCLHAPASHTMVSALKFCLFFCKGWGFFSPRL